jgi:hypothetical protein
VPSAAGVPSKDTLWRMAENIIVVVVQELIAEVDHAVFEGEQ